MTISSDALVIGGGLHGLSAALQLARRGLTVTLLERSRVGRHASGASAAGVRTLGRARAELPLALAAMEMWHHMVDLVGDDCGFEASGQVKVAETEAELADLRAKVDSLRADGFTHEDLIDADELRRLVPSLAPHCVGARIVRRDGAADPHRTLAAFLRSALKAGVDVREGVGVTSLRREGNVWRASSTTGVYEAPLLVNAAGAWAGHRRPSCGCRWPRQGRALGAALDAVPAQRVHDTGRRRHGRGPCQGRRRARCGGCARPRRAGGVVRRSGLNDSGRGQPRPPFIGLEIRPRASAVPASARGFVCT